MEMEIIIATPITKESVNESKDGKIKYLEFKNRQLEEENKLLLAMLAEALNGKSIVIREETLERKPKFKIGENLGGDIIISCR